MSNTQHRLVVKGRERLPRASAGPESWAWLLYGNRRDLGLPRSRLRDGSWDQKGEGDFLAMDEAGNVPTGQAISSGVQGLLIPRAHCKWSGRVWALVTNC